MGQRAKLADLLEENRTPRRPQCRVASVLENLDEEDRITLLRAIEDREIYHSDIARALTKMDYPISRQTISFHRRAICSCP